jgi:hypothetical protein
MFIEPSTRSGISIRAVFSNPIIILFSHAGDTTMQDTTQMSGICDSVPPHGQAKKRLLYCAERILRIYSEVLQSKLDEQTQVSGVKLESDGELMSSWFVEICCLFGILCSEGS